MALPSEALETLRTLLESDASIDERYAAVRQNFPGISLTRCDAGDVDAETPVLDTAQFVVYLIDTSEHCVRFTRNPAVATGLVVAQKR